MNPKKINEDPEALKNQALNLPDSPGVYLMESRGGETLYVGKAKSLKKRVRSYFTGVKDTKTRHLLSKIARFETIVTLSEGEALLLENNLIKQYRPKYNINLKDGKTYPVIKLTGEEYPRVYRTRRIVFDGSKYFGPFAKANQIDLSLNLIDQLFPLRKCRGELKLKSHPCLNYHIGRCSAPCCGKISQQDYLARVERVRLLLAGKTDALLGELKNKMNKAAESLKFEKARIYRDRIKALKELTEVQNVVDFEIESRDYIGLRSEGYRCGIAILQMRGGKLIGRNVFLLEDYSPEEDAFATFLAQYYSRIDNRPRTAYLSRRLDAELISDFLKELTGKKIRFRFPQKGKHAQLVRMAVQTAGERLESEDRQDKALKSLQETLNLPFPPRRIEGFDIAHLEGAEAVASMVAFLGGRPHKSDYRHYKIRSLNGKIDDFEAIREVVARRYTRVLNEKKTRPDLILIDGGKGQVNSAAGILRLLGIPEIPVVGLAKKNEELFLPEAKEPICLPESSEALKLLISVRDEAHRFATAFHKRLRDKKMSVSLLEKIEGIGKKRSVRLLKHFGSLRELSRKKPEEIAAAAGISVELANDLLSRLYESLS